MSDTKPVCVRCDGTGQICSNCGESELFCDGECCEEPHEWNGYCTCPDCKGGGR